MDNIPAYVAAFKAALKRMIRYIYLSQSSEASMNAS